MLHHLELNVSDLDRSVAFWGPLLERLGFSPFQSFEGGRSFRRGGAYLVFVQAAAPHLEAGYHRRRVGLSHVALTAEGPAQVDALQAALPAGSQLYADRYPFAGGPDHYALFFEDPDRFKVEVVAPGGGYTLHETTEAPAPALAEQLAQLNAAVFGGDAALDLGRALQAPAMHLLWASPRSAPARPVAFKLGYQERADRFYSWLGGVHPAHRRQGLARTLLRRQHAYCAAAGYTRVRTQTEARFRGMLNLDLAEGFQIVGALQRPSGAMRLVLDKPL